ncbi:MAG TPA: biotin/lipoate A/B protein ligase family protein [Candidatus Binatia bacterium]|nr:biotin/lipoate A/B protein ligase family protein [Candidatus Binatia bacterium]
MKYLDLTFPDPASNLACDEALLQLCESLEAERVLRIWEPGTHFAVVGYSNKVASEVDLAACKAMGIPVLRRCSGGGAVLQGPGCLNYALVYSARDSADGWGDIADSYRLVLGRHRRLFETLLARTIEIRGISDLAIDGWKFSGNAQHRRRRAVLFHGSFLLDLDTSVVEECLRMPSKQPPYRDNRPHRGFIKNLLVDSNAVKQALREEWRADNLLSAVPRQMIDSLVRDRYGRAEWNFKF